MPGQLVDAMSAIADRLLGTSRAVVLWDEADLANEPDAAEALAHLVKTTPGCRARQAKRPMAAGLRNKSRASAGKMCPATPGNGDKAPLIATTPAAPPAPVICIRRAIAAPAEWPTIRSGCSLSAVINAATPLAMPSSFKPSRPGMPVKPCPGRSGATTVQLCASFGARPRQECVAAPAPCSRRTTGPSPITCTCQRTPPSVTKRLASRFGQSRPWRFHCGASLNAISASIIRPAPVRPRG